MSLRSVKVRGWSSHQKGDAHFHEEGTKGRPHTGPSSEVILGSSESLIDLINSHTVPGTMVGGRNVPYLCSRFKRYVSYFVRYVDVAFSEINP